MRACQYWSYSRLTPTSLRPPTGGPGGKMKVPGTNTRRRPITPRCRARRGDVAWRIRDVLRRVRTEDDSLEEHLDLSVRTASTECTDRLGVTIDAAAARVLLRRARVTVRFHRRATARNALHRQRRWRGPLHRPSQAHCGAHSRVPAGVAGGDTDAVAHILSQQNYCNGSEDVYKRNMKSFKKKIDQKLGPVSAADGPTTSAPPSPAP